MHYYICSHSIGMLGQPKFWLEPLSIVLSVCEQRGLCRDGAVCTGLSKSWLHEFTICTCNKLFDSPFYRPPDKNAYLKLFFLFLNQKEKCVGTQKNRLNETVLLSTKTHL